MAAIDSINHRHGRGTIYPAATGITRAWGTKFERRTPRYTTRWSELPVVRG